MRSIGAVWLVGWLVGPWVGTPQEVPLPTGKVPGDIVLDLGSMQVRDRLGHGWSLAETARGRNYRWIKSMEAEITFDLEESTDLAMWIDAVPRYLAYAQQSVAVYVNGRFVTDWVCDHDIHFQTYRLTIPRRLLSPGRNQLILRMGYTAQIGRDPRSLSLCVDRIVLRPLRAGSSSDGSEPRLAEP